MSWQDHLVIAPIILPLIAGATMLLFDGRSRTVAAVLNLVSTFALLAIAISLVTTSGGPDPAAAVQGTNPEELGVIADGQRERDAVTFAVDVVDRVVRENFLDAHRRARSA